MKENIEKTFTDKNKLAHKLIRFLRNLIKDTEVRSKREAPKGECNVRDWIRLEWE